MVILFLVCASFLDELIKVKAGTVLLCFQQIEDSTDFWRSLFPKAGGVLYINQLYNCVLPLYIFNSSYQPRKEKKVCLLVFEWLGGSSPASWGHPITRQKVQQTEVGITYLKGPPHFKKACLLQAAPVFSKPTWVCQGWAPCTEAAWSKSLGIIVATSCSSELLPLAWV